MIVGINSGSFGTAGASDVKACVGSVRLSQTELSLTTFQNHWNAGIKVLVDFAGPFTGNGVAGIGSAQTWANNALAWYQAHTNVTNSPWVEILNEPAQPGSGWGSGANTQTNADAYRTLVMTASQTFRNALGSQCPAIVASYDGGLAGDPTSWGSKWWNSTVAPFVDGITMHQYAGDAQPSTSFSRTLAGRNATGKPVYVTELGWPIGSVGVFAGVSESQQAANITTMAKLLSDAGWCSLWTYFNYRDFTGNGWGVTRADGTHKPSFAALHTAFTTYDTGVTPPPPQGVLTAQVNPSNAAQFQVTAVPTGTALIHIAEAQDTSGTNAQFRGNGVDPGSGGSGFTAPFTLPLNFTPVADHPAVQALAYDSAAYSGGIPSGNQLGTWTPWVLTTPNSGTAIPTATTDAASSVTASGATLNGHANAHGVSGATFHFDLERVINGVPQTPVSVPSPDVLVGDVASTLAFSAEQHGSVNTGTSFTIGATGLADGLFLLAPIIAKGIGQTQSTITPGSGYTLVTSGDQQFSNANNGAHRLSLYKKVASSEASTTWTSSQSGNHAGASLAFAGVDATTPVAQVASQANASGTTCVCPSVNATAGQVLVTIAAFTNGDTGTPPSTTPTTTERVDTQSGAGTADVTLVVDTQPVTTTGATGTRTITFAGANGADTSAGMSVLLNPSTGGGTTNKAISWAATGLVAGAYQYRANVTSSGGNNVGSWVTFDIAGVPVISSLTIGSVTDTTAAVHAHIDPLGASTTYRVEVSTDDGVTWVTNVPTSAPFTTPQDI